MTVTGMFWVTVMPFCEKIQTAVAIVLGFRLCVVPGANLPLEPMANDVIPVALGTSSAFW